MGLASRLGRFIILLLLVMVEAVVVAGCFFAFVAGVRQGMMI